jgi:hypothetical protein
MIVIPRIVMPWIVMPWIVMLAGQNEAPGMTT